MDETKRIGLALAALAGALVICVVVTTGFGAFERFAADYNAPAPEVEGIEGLPAGVALDEEPNEIRDGYAIFDDRVVKLFATDESTLETCASAQTALFGAIPEGVAKYLLVTPTRASFEPSLSELSQNELDAIDSVYATMPGDVTCIDAAEALLEQTGAYLYYRTQAIWTPLGAYYASRALFESCGVMGVDLSEYRQDARRTFLGSYAAQFDLTLADDNAPIYLHDNLPNNALIFKETVQGESSAPFDAPAISISRGSYYASLGTNVAAAVIEGGATNGRVVLVIGDAHARLLATWLISSFERIVFVSQDNSDFSPEEFQALFSTYGITDFVLAQSVDSLSLGNGNSSLRKLAGEG